uniref:hypothetical protein n=1 Tax=Endozoicomonas acroporae TaxID=1701104 RepID=UPI0019D550DF
GTVANTTAVNSRVETEGKDANAGIGGGYVAAGGTVGNTTAVNSTVKTTGEDADAGIGGGYVAAGGTVANTTAVNSYVNGTQENSGSISNDQLLCQKADPRVLTDNCSLRTEFLDALNVSYSDACPVNAATMTLPTTVASSAATLSTGAIGRIALGTAAFVVAGVVLGRYIYRRYCCGSSPAAAGDPQELVAINTVGQAQKARTQPTIKEAREKPADVQRSRSHPPEPPGLQQPALPEKPPTRPRDSFFEELRG